MTATAVSTTGLVLTVTLVASESLAVSNIMPIVDRDLRAMYYSDAMKFSGDKKVLIREAA